MKTGKFLWALLALSVAPWAGAQVNPVTDSRFTVADIRVIGLARVSEGTVFNYLPVNIGDDMNPQKLRESVRALYATGFFRTVELRRDGDVLVVVVGERPSIESFELKGNKDIKTEDLTKSLRGVGLAQGKTFDRSVLEDVKGFLTDQYFSRGKYGVKIDAQVDELPDNRVNILIDIDEGDRAKIRQISIVGNTKFKEKDILETFELTTPRWNTWWKDSIRYSRETLQGDLEKLKSYYQDRGYANFEIESAPGDHFARQGRHVHHHEHPRGRDLQDCRRQDRRQHHRAGAGAAGHRAGDRAQGRHLLAGSHFSDAEVDREAAERRRLCLRQGRSGAQARRREEGGRDDLRRGPGQARVRAPHQLQGHRAHPGHRAAA